MNFDPTNSISHLFACLCLLSVFTFLESDIKVPILLLSLLLWLTAGCSWYYCLTFKAHFNLLGIENIQNIITSMNMKLIQVLQNIRENKSNVYYFFSPLFSKRTWQFIHLLRIQSSPFPLAFVVINQWVIQLEISVTNALSLCQNIPYNYITCIASLVYTVC